MQSELKPCDFCGSSDHLRVVTVGVMTSDMPDRPHRVVCSHIDHDDVQGPVAYGRAEAIAAWNTRASDAEITRLTEALREADENINLKADFIDATINQLAAKDQDIYELKEALRAAEEREKGLREALTRLRDCDWVISLPDRMDAVREIARAALKGPSHDA